MVVTYGRFVVVVEARNTLGGRLVVCTGIMGEISEACGVSMSTSTLKGAEIRYLFHFNYMLNLVFKVLKQCSKNCK